MRKLLKKFQIVKHLINNWVIVYYIQFHFILRELH